MENTENNNSIVKVESQELSDSSTDTCSPGSTFSNSPTTTFNTITKTEAPSVPKSTEKVSMKKKRKRKNSSLQENKKCPICSEVLETDNSDIHYEHEKQMLNCITMNLRPTRIVSRFSKCSNSSQGSSPMRWDTFQRLKNKRLGRQKEVSKKPNAVCPVCNISIYGSEAELNSHVDQCLERRGQSSPLSEAGEVDIEGFDSYEWAGQTRLRVSSMISSLTAGLLGSSTSRISRSHEDDDQIEVVVDEDENASFGQSQYSEADIIPSLTHEPKEDLCRKELRNHLIGEQTDISRKPSSSTKWSDQPEGEESVADKSRNTRDGRCLICMDEFNTPLVSTTCWHVYCEECWLRTLGVKKLCPQCNSIITAKDLRRIYL